MDQIRVMRVIVYEGPRALVERLVELSVHGTKRVGDVTIKAVTVAEFPELLKENEPCQRSCSTEAERAPD